MRLKMMVILGLMVIMGMEVFSQSYVILVQPAGSKFWGYSDLKGNMIIEPQFSKCTPFSKDGFAAIYDGKIKQFYFIDLKGEKLQTDISGYKLIEILGFGIKGFHDGFAPVKVQDKWGYLNTAGKLAVTVKYEKVTPFNEGFASVMRDGLYYVLDNKGVEHPLLVAGVVDLNEFSENLASFKTKDGLIGYVDGTGKEVIKAQFQAAGDFNGGIAWAKGASGTVGFINPQGAWVIDPKFDAAKDYDAESGLARIKTADKWGYVNKAGEVSNFYDSEIYEDFSCGLAKGRKNDKFGFYNAQMKWAIEPKFDGARDFKNGYAAVREGVLWGIIDKTGAWVIKPKFEDIKDVEIVK
jgi:hypothetical protein